MRYLTILFALILVGCAGFDFASLCSHAPSYISCVMTCVSEPDSSQCVMCVAEVGGDIAEAIHEARQAEPEELACPIPEDER